MKTKALSVFVLLFSLAACSQSPVATFDVLTPAPVSSATPWVAGTEMALATPTPYEAGTETAAVNTGPTPVVSTPYALPTFAFTQAVATKPSDFSPVLYGGKLYGTNFFLLLGGVSRDAWIDPGASVARFSGEATYSLHTLTQGYKYFVWGRAPEMSPTCRVYSIGTDADLDEANFVGVLDGWNITKRVVTELSPNGDFYRQAVLDWLTGEGVQNPQLGTLHIFRVDLEGDGNDEIFISATRLDGSQHTTQAGDYAIVLMRKVVGSAVVTIPLVADVYASQGPEITFPRTYSIVNFIDLNQDGILEVVVGIQKWEGLGAIVYRLDGQNVFQSLRAEC